MSPPLVRLTREEALAEVSVWWDILSLPLTGRYLKCGQEFMLIGKNSPSFRGEAVGVRARAEALLP